MNPKVTVYIPIHNYGRFLSQAVDSVFAQKYRDWELILINDGSTDETERVLASYSHHPQVTIVRQQHQGLLVSSNVALRLARGEYLMRLDADDYLDENALLVLSNILETYPDVALVYPDNYLVNEAGDILDIMRRAEVTEGNVPLNLPAHGACTMVRVAALLALGGYSEEVDCQDGYDLWIKVVRRYPVYHVNLPLFYYRRHERNLTQNLTRLFAARRAINRRYVQQHLNGTPLSVLAMIPVRRAEPDAFNAPLAEVAGQPLLRYTVDEALKTPRLHRVIVTSEDPDVLAYASAIPGVAALPRPAALARPNTRIEPTIQHVLDLVFQREGYAPDAIMLLHDNSPLRRCEHLEEAIDTMLIFQVDSVISVTENLHCHYLRGKDGLVPLRPQRRLRLERNALYTENGAIYLFRREAMMPASLLGKRVGHFVMPAEESVQIDTPYERWLVEQLLLKRRSAERMALAASQPALR